MANDEVVDVGTAPEIQDLPEILPPEQALEVEPQSMDPNRLASLVNDVEVSQEIPLEAPQEVAPEGISVEVETPPIEEIPLAIEDQELRRNSRIIHVVLSLLVILLVVGGAALAAYLYSRSDSTFIKLPKLPFIQEPQSREEQTQTSELTSIPETTEPDPNPVTSPEIVSNPEPEVVPPLEVEVTTKGGEEITTTETPSVVIPSDWKTFTSRSWGFSFKYPPSWYLYPRDLGSLGEATMVASSPLSSLENDLRRVTVNSQDVVVGIGVVAKDKPSTQTTLQYIKDKATLFGVSSPEEMNVGSRKFVRVLSNQGGVLNYYISNDKFVYYISIKPADYSSIFADQVEKIVEGLNF